ncbi:DUF1570 domain-containing protein [Novosphingobium guangzhouense]|uniref:DUF1570 domain-containing protein n=1 Tax=Novosphingobium guangzhouense TaxID=1850347 RepID=A0A2K2FST5_9SPHN|nr:DUF1570 domain-containing protein [Novosphingobium guangzhouense]PNU01838.1 hypothetical protein A8V01_11960 [Novosphingobium guangzhouense]
MRFGILVAALAVCFWGGQARAAWIEASSDHFVIYANDSDKDITRFSQQLERYHAGMAFVLGQKVAKPSPSNRVTVYVVKNEREVRQLHGGDNKFVGGFYVPSAGGSLAIVPSVQSGSGSTVTWSMIVLLHEYAHHFLISTSSAAMPRWLSEGAAEFFASAKFEADGGLWLGRPASHRAGELFYAQDVKAADLLDPTEYDKRKHTTYDAFYGKSWLLYHYLTFGGDRKGQMTRYVELLAKGRGQRDAALEAFGDFDVLEKNLDSYLKKRRMTALTLTPEVLSIGPVSLRTLSAGEAEIMPVRIRSRRGVSSEEAATLLVEARQIAAKYPQDPAVLAALAECEFDAGHDREAIAAADSAIAHDPSQVNAYIQKGYALFREAEDNRGDDKERAAAYKAARAPFIALNRIENDHPLPLVYFYRSFVEQGQTPSDLAISGLIRAVELAPFDLGLRMNLGTALLRLGRSPEARIVLGPVANNPHVNSGSRFARSLIERMEKDPSWKGEGMGQEAPEEPEAEGDADK